MPPVIPSRIFFPETSVISIRNSALNDKTGILSEFHGHHRLAHAGTAARAPACARSGFARRRRVAGDPAAYRGKGEKRGGSGAPAARALRLGLRAARGRTGASRRNAGLGQRQARAAAGGARARAPCAEGGNRLARRAQLSARGSRLLTPRPCRTRAGSLRGAAARRPAPRHRVRRAVPGTLTQTSVYPREVVKYALKHN